MYSQRSLLLLTTFAMGLWTAVFLGVGNDRISDRRAPGPERILPEASKEDAISAIVWERQDRDFALVRDRGRDGAWALAGPDRVIIAQAVLARDVVADIVGTLELLAPLRTVPASAESLADTGLEPPRLLLRIELLGGETITLRLGRRLPGLDRAWLRRDDRGEVYLIPGYAARALDRDLDDVRESHLLPPQGAITALELRAGNSELLLTDRLRLVHAGELGGHVRADPAEADALVATLAALIIERFVAPATGDGQSAESSAVPPFPELTSGALVSVRVLSDQEPAFLSELGPCPDDDDDAAMRLVQSSLGVGCVAKEPLAALAERVAQRQRMFARALLSPDAIAEVRLSGPAAAAPVHLQAAGATWNMGGERAEDGDVNRWLIAVRDAAGGRYLPVAEVGDVAPVLVIEVIYADGQREELAIASHPRHGLLARRQREPIYLVLDAPSAADILPVSELRFRPRQILRADYYGLRRAVVRQRGRVRVELTRGQLMSDWTALRGDAPPGGMDEYVSALRDLSNLVAGAYLATQAAPEHGLVIPRLEIELEFDPGPLDAAEPVRAVLQIGSLLKAGCAARLAGRPDVFAMEAALCNRLLAPWHGR